MSTRGKSMSTRGKSVGSRFSGVARYRQTILYAFRTAPCCGFSRLDRRLCILSERRKSPWEVYRTPFWSGRGLAFLCFGALFAVFLGYDCPLACQYQQIFLCFKHRP